MRALLIAFCFCFHASQATGLPSDIQRALKDASVPAAQASFLVVDLQSGTTLLSHQADKAMNPASVMKLLTTAAALDTLGPQFTWHTEFLATAEPRNGVLDSPLYIRASGDPKITFEDLERIFASLRAQGINTLAGGIVVDKSIFAPIDADTTSFDNSPLRPYNVTPDAMLFNFKAVGFKMLLRDGALQITPEPFPEGIELIQNVKLVSGPCGDWKTKLRATFDDGPQRATARFSGTYSTECGEREWFVSLLGHDAFFSGSARWMWKRIGGGEVGAIRTGRVPANARVLATHTSPALSAVVTDINKFSNNVMARHTLLAIDAQTHGAPAQARRGAEGVKDWLRSKKIDIDGLHIENGSGLSREERVSTSTLSALLKYMHRHPAARTYLDSLPIAGVDGTLTSRLRSVHTQANAWLKTGGLAEVSALAGYVRGRDGRMLSFVGVLNHPRAPQAFGALERAVEWAAQ